MPQVPSHLGSVEFGSWEILNFLREFRLSQKLTKLENTILHVLRILALDIFAYPFYAF